MTDLERVKQLYEEALQLKDEPCWSTGWYNDLKGAAVCYELPGDKAYDLMAEAAKLGYPDAQYELGLYYVFRSQNRAVPEDCEAAEKRRSENREECIAGFDWMKAAADAGHVKAASTVGHMLFLGNEQSGTIAPDNAAAIPYLEIAAQSDDLAMYHLGRAYEGGYGVPQDDKKAFSWFEKATKTGSTFSLAWTPLGECYLFGKGTTKDIPKAMEALVSPALIGSPRAQLLLGGIYMGGVGFEHADFSKAELALSKIPVGAKEYKHAQELLAALPDAKEQYREWQLQQDSADQQQEKVSQGVPDSTRQTEGDSVTDLERGKQLYEEALNLEGEQCWVEGTHNPFYNIVKFSVIPSKAAAQLVYNAGKLGYTHAEYQLGLYHFFDYAHKPPIPVGDVEGCRKRNEQCVSECKTALAWLKHAAENGHGGAALVVGSLYLKGDDLFHVVPKDEVMAFRYFQMGANSNADAMYWVADCYDYGKGVSKDKIKAFLWYEKAANGGSMMAWFHLGDCYYRGSGTTKNIPKAIEAFQRAVTFDKEDIGPTPEIAKYYLALIYMGAEGFEYVNFPMAKELLTSVNAEESGVYYDMARELLADMPNAQAEYQRWERQTKKTGSTSKKGVVLGVIIAIIAVIAAILIIGSGGSGNSSHSNTGYVPPSSYEEKLDPAPTNPVPVSNPYHHCYSVHGGSVLPASDSRYYEKSELAHLNAEELIIARNEIYARHGYIFKDADLAEYFEACDWYSGTVSGSSFSDSVFNEYEKANIKTIVACEKDAGYRS